MAQHRASGARFPVDPPRPPRVEHGQWPGESAGDPNVPGSRHNNLLAQMCNAYNWKWARGVDLVEAETRRVFDHREAESELRGYHAHAGGDKMDPRRLPEADQYTKRVRVQPDGSIMLKSDGTPDLRANNTGGNRNPQGRNDADRTFAGMQSALSAIGYGICFDEVKHTPLIKPGDDEWEMLDDGWGAKMIDDLETKHQYKISETRFNRKHPRDGEDTALHPQRTPRVGGQLRQGRGPPRS